jgi:hypothetical protein
MSFGYAGEGQSERTTAGSDTFTNTELRDCAPFGIRLRLATGVRSGVQFERNREQLRTTERRETEPKRAQINRNPPAGGRAVAGSNPVSPIPTKGPQTRAFRFSPGALCRGRRVQTGSKSCSGGSNHHRTRPMACMKRQHGAGELYVKWVLVLRTVPHPGRPAREPTPWSYPPPRVSRRVDEVAGRSGASPSHRGGEQPPAADARRAAAYSRRRDRSPARPSRGPGRKAVVPAELRVHAASARLTGDRFAPRRQREPTGHRATGAIDARSSLLLLHAHLRRRLRAAAGAVREWGWQVERRRLP